MNVTFYQNFSDRYTVYKSISEITSVDCKLIDGCSVDTPVIRIRYNSALTRCNYAYIADWGKYYYVENPRLEIGGQMQLNLTVDVLQTYADAISQLNVNAVYAQGTNRTYVPDARVAMQNAIDIQTIAFPFAVGSPNFSTNSYVMTVIGGASSPATGGGENG